MQLLQVLIGKLLWVAPLTKGQEADTPFHDIVKEVGPRLISAAAWLDPALRQLFENYLQLGPRKSHGRVEA